MSLNTINDYKLIDSLLGIESITWEFSTDVNFNNIISTESNTGTKLVNILPLVVKHNANIFCRVKINGDTGSTDWFLVKEDKSSNIYVTKSFDQFDYNQGDDKVIIKEYILDKDGHKIYEFSFEDTDEILHIPSYDKMIDIDFLSHLRLNTEWFYEQLTPTTNGNYVDGVYTTGDDFLILPIIDRHNIKTTSQLYCKKPVWFMNDVYIELRMELSKLAHSYKYIYFKSEDGVNIITVDNIGGTFNISINDTEFVLNDVDMSEDYMHLLGISSDGKIYYNHKVVIYTGLILPNIHTIHFGNMYEDEVMETGEFTIDYVRMYRLTDYE